MFQIVDGSIDGVFIIGGKLNIKYMRRFNLKVMMLEGCIFNPGLLCYKEFKSLNFLSLNNI